jgi:hypothetical protein
MYVNGKMRPVETVPGIVGGGNKGEWRKGWIQLWDIWYVIRISVMSQCTPTQSNSQEDNQALLLEERKIKTFGTFCNYNIALLWVNTYAMVSKMVSASQIHVEI